MKMEIRRSVFTNEQELLKALIEIHLQGEKIELDPMYFKGGFYKNGVEKPDECFDINPEIAVVSGSEDADREINSPILADARNLHWFEDGFFNNMILDPPFMFGIHGKTKNYYSSRTHGILKDFNDLKELYLGILKEAYRLLKKGGILIFKCQDFTDSFSFFTHILVYKLAREIGFYAKDLAILVKPNKVYNPNLTQRHLRKIHTYFWVFQKKNVRIDI